MVAQLFKDTVSCVGVMWHHKKHNKVTVNWRSCHSLLQHIVLEFAGLDSGKQKKTSVIIGDSAMIWIRYLTYECQIHGKKIRLKEQNSGLKITIQIKSQIDYKQRNPAVKYEVKNVKGGR